MVHRLLTRALAPHMGETEWRECVSDDWMGDLRGADSAKGLTLQVRCTRDVAVRCTRCFGAVQSGAVQSGAVPCVCCGCVLRVCGVVCIRCLMHVLTLLHITGVVGCCGMVCGGTLLCRLLFSAPAPAKLKHLVA